MAKEFDGQRSLSNIIYKTFVASNSFLLGFEKTKQKFHFIFISLFDYHVDCVLGETQVI